MGVKEFLEQALLIDNRINTQLATLNHYRRLSQNIGSSRLEEHVSHSKSAEAPYAKWVEKITDKEKEINAEIDRLLSVKLSITEFIDSVENPKWQCILRNRYILGLPWSKIAEDMDCGLSTIQRIHKQIIEKLEKQAKNPQSEMV